MYNPTLKLKYYIDNPDNFKIETNLKPEAIKEFIFDFLRTQIGAGVDKNKPIEKETYEISIMFDLTEDKFYIKSDTGNLSLRDGILMDILKKVK